MRRPNSRRQYSNIEQVGTGSTNYVDPMRVTASWHDFDSKTLLDGTILQQSGTNGNAVRNDVKELLDHLFKH